MKISLILIILYVLINPCVAMDDLVNIFNQFTPANNDACSAGLSGIQVFNVYSSSTLFSNPAALGLVDKCQMGLNLKAKMGKINIDIAGAPESNGGSIKYNPIMDIGDIFALLPMTLFQKNMVVGIGYNNKFNLHSYAEINDDKEEYNNYEKINSHGGVNFITLGLGSRYGNFWGGINLNLAANSSLEYDSHKWYPPSDNTHYYTKENTDFSGYNCVFGLGMNTDNLICAISYGTSMKLKTEGNFFMKRISNGEETVLYDYNYDYKLIYPAEFSLNAEYAWNDFVFVSELGYIKLKNMKVETDTLTTQIYPNIKNGFKFKIGSEYHKNVIYRAGLGIQNIPIQDHFVGMIYWHDETGNHSMWVDYYDDKPKYLYNISTGVSIPIKQNIMIDIAIQYNRFSEIEDILSDFEGSIKREEGIWFMNLFCGFRIKI
jgi:hypothetical protein